MYNANNPLFALTLVWYFIFMQQCFMPRGRTLLLRYLQTELIFESSPPDIVNIER